MDLTQCTTSWNINWNCNCTGKAGATAVTIVIDGVSFQGCMIQSQLPGAAPTLCCPGAAQGSNGDVMTATSVGGQIFGGVILIDGDDAVFCIKTITETEGP